MRYIVLSLTVAVRALLRGRVFFRSGLRRGRERAQHPEIVLLDPRELTIAVGGLGGGSQVQRHISCFRVRVAAALYRASRLRKRS